LGGVEGGDDEEGGDEGSWCLFVCNQGEIPEALRQSLFEPFVTGRSRGVGLGLATVKQVCDVNEWSVRVESGKGQTCFAVTGPILRHQAAAVTDSMESMHG